jgi:hypothetical protein
MKRILIFLALSLAAYVSFSQSPIYGRLRVISGTYDNYFQNGTDTFKLGWRTDRFQLKYNTNKRFIDLIKSDSTVIIYNKLILTSPNDTMLSVRGMFNATSDSYINSLRIGKGVSNIATNTAFGVTALNSITTGNENTGIGYHAMMATTTGDGNTAIGAYSFIVNTTGQFNTAVGTGTLNSNISGNNNVAIGRTSLYRNSTGDFNVAIGVNSLNLNTTGHYNTAIGALALWKVTGSANIGVGMGAIQNMTSGDYNIAIGQYTGYGFNSGANNILIGFQAGRGLTTYPTNNIFIGHNAGNVGGQKVDVTGSMAIGYEAYTNANNQYVYGNTSVTEHNFRSGKVIMRNVADTTLSVRGTSRFNGDMFPQQNIMLLNTTNTTKYGIIYKDAATFIHNFNYGDNGSVTTDGYNTFLGENAGNLTMGTTATVSNQSSFNTGVGHSVLLNNTTGYYNTAIGATSLTANTEGYYNTANGVQSLSSNTTGYRNTASGMFSLNDNISGYDNTASGMSALYKNTTGFSNTAFGYQAGMYIADGASSNTTSDYCLFLGVGTKALADNDQNEIVIGYNAIGLGSNTVNIGNTSITQTQLNGKVVLPYTADTTLSVRGNAYVADTTFMEHLEVTDSVTLKDALFDIYHLAPDSDSLIVADDGIINLRTGAYGELRVWVFNSGMYAEYAVVILNVDGSIGIMTENSANVTNVGGTDGKLNIYDAGAYTTIENKLGGSRTIKYVFTH